jgi:hypothetical protein
MRGISSRQITTEREEAMTEVFTERPAELFPDHALTEAPTERVQTLLGERPARSIFRRAAILRCPECGSFFDAPRRNPETGNLARKCISCDEWYPVATLRWEGSD